MKTYLLILAGAALAACSAVLAGPAASHVDLLAGVCHCAACRS